MVKDLDTSKLGKISEQKAEIMLPESIDTWTQEGGIQSLLL